MHRIIFVIISIFILHHGGYSQNSDYWSNNYDIRFWESKLDSISSHQYKTINKCTFSLKKNNYESITSGGFFFYKELVPKKYIDSILIYYPSDTTKYKDDSIPMELPVFYMLKFKDGISTEQIIDNILRGYFQYNSHYDYHYLLSDEIYRSGYSLIVGKDYLIVFSGSNNNIRELNSNLISKFGNQVFRLHRGARLLVFNNNGLKYMSTYPIYMDQEYFKSEYTKRKKTL